MLSVVCSQSDDGGCARSVIVCTCIVYLATEVAQMVVVGCEYITTVVTLTLDFGDNIEALVILQETVFDVDLNLIHCFCPFSPLFCG